MQTSNTVNPQGEQIIVSSVNCQGLQTMKKRIDVLDYLKKTKSHIICLQDTHLTKKDLRSVHTLWNNECYLHGIKTDSRGVAILFNKNFEYRVLNTIEDEIGNMITLDLKISNDFTIRIINIYAPNTDSPEFFEKIEQLHTSSTSDYTIICGDHNIVLDTNIDCVNYKHTNNPKARRKYLEIMKKHKLNDTYRVKNPHLREYTWAKKNSKQKARLRLHNNI